MATTNKTTTRKRARKNAGASSGETNSRITMNHDQVRQWIEERGGKPSIVKSTQNEAEGGGILRVDFPGYSGSDTLEHISWEEFFQKFEENNLAFLYQEQTSGGEESRFNKFVSRDEMNSGEPGKSEMD